MASDVSASTGARPLSTEALHLGELLRAARREAGLKLRDVASRAGTSPTTLSLLERGHRAVDPELLDRIVAITGAEGGDAFRLAGMVPPHAAAEVLGSDIAGVLEGGSLSAAARRALRRTHLGALAARVAPGTQVPPVDAEALLDREFGIELRPVAASEWAHFSTPELVEYPSGLDGAGQRAQRNLVLGHMAGHALLARETKRRPACAHAAGGTSEAEASWLAGLLLMPRRILESEAQLLAGNYHVDQRQGFESFIAEVAGAFAVPLWLAARHVGDAGLLAWAAGLEDS